MALCLCIYFVFIKKNIILSLFKIDTLNFYILTYPLKIYVIGLLNLISMNIFFDIKFRQLKTNKRNDKRFNNRSYLLFLLIGIFLKHLWLIPNILKWQDCKIFTKLIPSQTPSRSRHRRCSVKKGVLKNLRSFTDLMVCNFI